MSKLTHEERLMMLGELVERFEDYLESKGIVIENLEKEQDECASNIYGTEYGDLTDELESVLVWWGLLDREGRDDV